MLVQINTVNRQLLAIIEASSDERALEMLKLGLRWADLRCRPRIREANLSGADLMHADLSRLDLQRANLSRANLTGAILTGAHLGGADLRGALLRGCCLKDANLCGAQLVGADFGDKYSGITIPTIDDIHVRLRDVIGEDGCRLKMSKWHSECGTTHCRAGWVVTLAGENGRALEEAAGTAIAAALIYMASDPTLPCIPDFHCEDALAFADIDRLAKQSTNLAAQLAAPTSRAAVSDYEPTGSALFGTILTVSDN